VHMKSKAILLIAVCLSLTVILSGCVDCEADSDCENGEICDADGVCVSESAGAAGGITGKFVLPVVLWQNEPFTVDFQVENTGETDVALAYDDVSCVWDTWPHSINVGGVVHVCPTGYYYCDSATAMCCTTGGREDCVNPPTLPSGIVATGEGALNVYVGGISLKDYGAGAVDATTGALLNANYLAGSDLLIDRNAYVLYAIRNEGGAKIPGGMGNLNFGTTVAQLKVPDGYMDVKATFEATMCYPYRTIGVATVCTGDIKPGEEAVCKSNEDKSVESSTAPVVITKVRQAGARQSQTFTINFENKGTGTPYVKTFTGLDTDNCVTNLDKIDRNYVTVSSIRVGETGEALDCSGSKVSMAAGTVNCHYTSTTTAVSEAQLLIELDYSYKDKVTEEYTIKGV